MTGLLLAAWIGCQAFDLSSTAIALRDPAFREANPLLRHHGYEIKISVNAGMLLWQRRMHGKRKNVVSATMAIAGCSAGAVNVAKVRQGQPQEEGRR